MFVELNREYVRRFCLIFLKNFIIWLLVGHNEAQRPRITVSYGIKVNNFRLSTNVSNSDWIRT